MIIGIASVAGLLASSETETTVHNNSVFVLDLQGSIAERYQPTPIDQLLDEEQSVYGLNDISASIAKAKENDVPFYKDNKLAETLSKLEIGDAIPPELYEVVAEILVFVDDMDKMKAKLQQADMLS